MLSALRQGRIHEFVPFAGQSVGAIRDLLPAGEIVRRMVAEAAEHLGRAASLVHALRRRYLEVSQSGQH